MTILARLELWKEQGAISTEQQAHLASLSRGEPFSLSLELNLLLYAGVLAFVAGLGWTISTWSQQLGDVLVLAILSIILTASTLARSGSGRSSPRLYGRASVGEGQTRDERRLCRTRPGNTSIHNANPATNQSGL
jgi:hypothetical protein